MHEVIVAQTDHLRAFEVSPGDLVSIRLEENPTTGYQWEVDEFDEQVIVVEHSDFSMAPGTGIGGGGIRTLAFRARSRGTVVLQMKLRREWEPEETAIDRFEVTIRVRG